MLSSTSFGILFSKKESNKEHSSFILYDLFLARDKKSHNKYHQQL